MVAQPQLLPVRAVGRLQEHPHPPLVRPGLDTRAVAVAQRVDEPARDICFEPLEQSRLMVARRDELDQVAVGCPPRGSRVHERVQVVVALVLGAHAHLVPPWVIPPLHRAEQVTEHHDAGTALAGLVKVPLDHIAPTQGVVPVDVGHQQQPRRPLAVTRHRDAHRMNMLLAHAHLLPSQSGVSEASWRL